MQTYDLIKLGIILVASIFMSCGNNLNSPEHQMAVDWHKTIKDLHEDLKDKVAQLEEENEGLAEAVWKMKQPDVEVLRRIKRHQRLIAEYQGMLESQKIMIAQNETYLDRHENAALSAAEIRVQHEEIYKNLIMVQEAATQTHEEIEVVLNLYDALEKDLPT